MHDLRALRADPAGFDAALARRRLPPEAAAILALDVDRRAALAAAQDVQSERNALSKAIGQAKRQNADTAALEVRATVLRDSMTELTRRAEALDAALRGRLEILPNQLDPDVPDGADEAANRVLHQSAAPPPPGQTASGAAAREHFELGEALGQMLFEPAARMSGARFTILQGGLARLERALGQFMLDHAVAHGFTETQVPLLVNDAAAYGSDKLPKFADDLFRTTDGRWLIPTAEVALVAMVMDQIVPAASLPIRLTALSECFRSEAGSAGRDTRGMLRQHQFRKVEMVAITHPDASDAEHERMTQCAEAVLTALGLVWRRIVLCAGDTGFGATKTYDLEVWLPGQQAWREISSCSNTRGFQARRMNTRLRGADGKIAGPVHTLNGSGVAVGRALIAVMETHQQPDGAILVPEPLRPWLGGLDRIGP